MEEVLVVPECSPELKPIVGQKFQSQDFAFAFYDVRLSKRCGCKASISFKFFSEEGLPGYIIQEFNEVHNHYMVARDIKAYTHEFDVQMVLDDMANKKELSKAFDVRMVLDDTLMMHFSVLVIRMYCMIFTLFTGKDNHGRPVTFAAGLVHNEKIGAFAWLFKHFVECMGVAPKMIVTDQDLGMRSAIEEVLVGTRHRWCMWHIMHKLATKVPNRLLRDEDFKKEFNACVLLNLLEPHEFEEEWNGVVERHGLEDIDWFNTLYDYRTTSISESENSFFKNFLKPRANIAKFYLNFNNALEFQRNSRTKLDYHDATALPILATTLSFEKHASTMYTDSMFKKIQEEIVEGNDRCRVLGFSSTDMVNTYKLGDNNRNSYFVRHNKTDESYSCDCKLNNEVKKIPDKYSESRWMKTPLAKAVHGQFDDTLPTKSIGDDRQIISKQGILMFYGFLRRFETDIDVLRAFVGGVEELGNSLQSRTPTTSASEKRRMIEEFCGMVRPEVVEVHPLDVVKTKGHANSSASRVISKRENAI
ncbi:protein FAR-RED IMPAIRED RESPONSE 1-like [Salvia splendens]|uniref:protein FAR-RED IMPAIRED RESPONSE 1-like n=1 Tax=Salvia splendens TaxID=180675 RepID=UPI001C27F84E|nr:protein FAR-RED IMPAIRED RESPONSE 1-like [Salvia splendens]